MVGDAGIGLVVIGALVVLAIVAVSLASRRHHRFRVRVTLEVERHDDHTAGSDDESPAGAA